MSRPWGVRRVTGVAAAVVLLLAVVLGLAGCGAAGTPGSNGEPPASPGPSAGSSGSAASSGGPTPGPVSVPADAVTLAQLGFVNGPVRAVAIPASAILSDRVDQPSSVTVVFTRPTAAELYDYLRRSLTGTGFSIGRSDDVALTFTVSGYGWSGAFTGSGGGSALYLRPA